MSEENVDAFKRVVAAANRRDVEAALEDLDPEIEGTQRFRCCSQERRRCFGGTWASANCSERSTRLGGVHLRVLGVRDLGDRIVGIGSFRARGKESAVEVESPLGYLVEFENGKAIRMRSYLDPKEALEAAGLRE